MTPAGPGISRLEILRAWPVAVCPNCGCCGGWVAHMEAAGFAVDVVETDDLEPLRKQVGVPTGKASCHTAQVDGYFVEGLVPADDVKRLLREHPSARGITAPGMPMGSPGMEVSSGATPTYTVLLVGPRRQHPRIREPRRLTRRRAPTGCRRSRPRAPARAT